MPHFVYIIFSEVHEIYYKGETVNPLEYKDVDLKEAAFLLHQATERYYGAIQLVFTGYKPKTHNIE